ncbi:hypothetical protein V8C86DRAFT_3142247 [Haematococcus lacustris]
MRSPSPASTPATPAPASTPASGLDWAQVYRLLDLPLSSPDALQLHAVATLVHALLLAAGVLEGHGLGGGGKREGGEGLVGWVPLQELGELGALAALYSLLPAACPGLLAREVPLRGVGNPDPHPREADGAGEGCSSDAPHWAQGAAGKPCLVLHMAAAAAQPESQPSSSTRPGLILPDPGHLPGPTAWQVLVVFWHGCLHEVEEEVADWLPHQPLNSAGPLPSVPVFARGILHRANCLALAPNAGLPVYPSWLPSLQRLALTGSPLLLLTDYCEEAMLRAQHLLSALVPALAPVLPLQLNPVRQPEMRSDHGNALPACSNAFLAGYASPPPDMEGFAAGGMHS